MLSTRHLVSRGLFLALLLFAFPGFAYLDGATGTVIVGAVLGVLATIGVFFSSVWAKITSPFRKEKDGLDDRL
ncbi:MAG: hypothetical protein KAZ88_01805 [Acidimicrobiia bacterium]|jgi:uncharacterized YccA/Bax inhibitor family protein|nr:hypothetical protein [Acidimicrobiia bacterium]MBP8179708.1 hypothetical protein [Acidimicrobiia bacterium]